MDAGTITMLGFVFATILTLSEIIKRLIDSFVGKKDKKDEVVYDKDMKTMVTNTNNKVNTLYEQHSRVDSEGTPLWYVPRGLSNTQKDIVKLQYDMIEKMATITRLLDRIELRMGQNN